jgi:hypothetical protein
MNRTKKSRLNLRIPTTLLEWARRFARAKNSNVTRLIVDFLTEEQASAKKERHG